MPAACPGPSTAPPSSGSSACGQVVSIPVTVRVQPAVHDGAYAMTALQQAFTFLTAGWRQAAADDAADSGFWNAVAGPR